MSHRWDATATQPSRRLAAGLGVGAVVVAAALVATLPETPQTQPAKVSVSEEPVSRIDLACPSGAEGAVVKVASAAGLPSPSPSGGKTELDVEQAGGRSTVDLVRGEVTPVEAGASAVVLRAAQEAAIGLVATRGERVGGSLAAAGCRAAQPEWWFTGAGGGIDHSSVLFLTNTDEGPATVDVRLHGASGSVDQAGTRGMTVGPGETLKVPLAEVAPGSDELTVEVTAGRGRVVAQLLDTVQGAGGSGREWLPPSAPPGTDAVLPGVPSGADRAELLVTNPGEEQALVDLEIVTENGAFVPLGDEQVSVDPGSIARVDLTKALKGRAAAVHLHSGVPVAGAVRSFVGGDVGYAGAAEPLGEPVGVVVVGDRTELQVVGGDEPAALELVVYGPGGSEVLRRQVTAPPSGMVQVATPAEAAYAVLLPRSGGGYAAGVHSGPGVAVQPTTLLPLTVRRAAVLPWTGQSAS